MNTGQSQPAHTNHKSLKQHTTNSHSHTPPCHPYSTPHHVNVTHTAPTLTHTPHHVTHTAHPITHTPRPVTCTLHSTVNTCTDKHDNWTQLSLDQWSLSQSPQKDPQKDYSSLLGSVQMTAWLPTFVSLSSAQAPVVSTRANMGYTTMYGEAITSQAEHGFSKAFCLVQGIVYQWL